MFTDIHHHVIYGVDDGAQTPDDAKEMLRNAAEQGVGQILCTSHALPGREVFDLERYHLRLAEERAWCKSAGLELLLGEGCEILWDESATRLLREHRLPTLNGNRYVLIEFLPHASFNELTHAALSLGMAGFNPIYAHVERYACLRKGSNLQLLRDEYGVFLQMNARTVLESGNKGFFADHWPRRVLSAGMIDIVASDAHDTKHRPCRMKSAYQLLIKQFGESYAKDLCVTIPTRVFMGDRI